MTKRIIEAQNSLPCGYAGGILRINLTDSTTEVIPTSKYVPRYVGGRAVCNRIFWDEVRGRVGAFDPENKIIVMTGPMASTGLPSGGRITFTGVSPNCLPEQYSHSNMGGFFGSMLKWAGYDGLIIEGRATKHTYVYIQDDKVQFLDADEDGLWGELVHETQDRIFEKFGYDAHSIVIGPAGENLCRNASIVNGSDCVAAKAGFGAVFGSKNLKAIAVRGTGCIRPGNLEKVEKLFRTSGKPTMEPNPPFHMDSFWGVDLPKGSNFSFSFMACSQGCNGPCQLWTDFYKPTNEAREPYGRVIKCLECMAFMYEFDTDYDWHRQVSSHKQSTPKNHHYNRLTIEDPSDPDLPTLQQHYNGDRFDLWKTDFDMGNMKTWLETQYGLDKWDLNVWLFPWLAMCKKEGLFDELDFGMEVDVGSPEFVRRILHMLVYREGIGDVLAEGMARAIRTFGKEKYGDSIYHGRSNSDTGEKLAVPVSFESGWGHCSHWQGRGFEGCPPHVWLTNSLTCMVDTRDAVCSQHSHDWIENYKEYKDDPYHSRVFARSVIRNDDYGELKDSLVTCEHKSPNIAWPSQESELFSAATGIEVSEEDLFAVAEQSKLLYRAILMRNYGRDRDMEANEMFPFLTYPDPWGNTASWEDWNDLIDIYYDERGWDLKTGWPKRSTWEEYGLKDVADELEGFGLLPEEHPAEYKHASAPRQAN